jgi:hypothetical protein
MSKLLDTTTAPKPTDRSALLMMLAYIEAECRRLGAEAAARHAALAAALVPDPDMPAIGPDASIH